MGADKLLLRNYRVGDAVRTGKLSKRQGFKEVFVLKTYLRNRDDLEF
jgi:hypothetical protein